MSAPAVRLYGKSGTFYNLNGDAVLNTEQTFDQVAVPGWAPHAGKTFGWSAFADGNLFIGGQDLRGNSTQPTGVDLLLSIFKPAVPSLTHIQVETDQGQTEVVGSNGVTGGAPMGAVGKVTVAGEDWIVFMSGAPYLDWEIAGNGVFPFLTVVRKLSGTWQVDYTKSMTADELSASSDAGVLAFPDQVNSFDEHYAGIRGAAEMGVLPGTTCVVVTQYFNEDRPSGAKGGSLVVIDVATKTVVAYYEHPYAGADPAVTDMGMRSVLVDPRRFGSKHRVIVLSDCYHSGSAAATNVFQEFEIDVDAGTIVPVSVPMREPKSGRKWGNGCIDSQGVLWLIEEGQSFLAGDVCVFKSPRVTERRPFSAADSLQWADRPFVDAPPDIRTAPPAGTQIPWGKAIEDPVGRVILWQSLNAKVYGMRRLGRGDRLTVRALHTVDLDYKNQIETQESLGDRGRVLPGEPCIDPDSHVVWWPLGQLDSSHTTPVYPPASLTTVDEWMYRFDLDLLFAEPQFRRATSGGEWIADDIAPTLPVWRPGDKVLVFVTLTGGGESRSFRKTEGWKTEYDDARFASGFGPRWGLFSRTMEKGDPYAEPVFAWVGGVLNADWVAMSLPSARPLEVVEVLATIHAASTAPTRPGTTTRRPRTRIVGFYGCDGHPTFSGLSDEVKRASNNGAGVNPSSMVTDEELPVPVGTVVDAKAITLSSSQQWAALTVSLAPALGADPELVSVHSLPALSSARTSPSQQDDYHSLLASHHRVGSWLRILDEDERPLWEVSDIIDGGVSFDTDQVPDRTLDITVMDAKGRLLAGAPSEEAAEARRFVQAIYELEHADGWIRFPMFTGPLDAGGLKRQGAEVQVRSAGKESLYLGKHTTWEAQHYPKATKIADAIHDIAAAQGERKFRLPALDDRLAKAVAIPRFAEAWTYIQRIAGRAGMVAYFDGEGYLSLRPAHPRSVGYVFDGDVVLTIPEIDDDNTVIVSTGVTTGPDPSGPEKPLHVAVSLPAANPFSPQAMARHGVPRRSIATDQLDKKKLADLEDHSRGMLHVATKTVSFECLPVLHLRPGWLCRIVGDYEGESIDDRFLLRRGFWPATALAPMTIGTWEPVGVNWRQMHHRQHAGAR